MELIKFGNTGLDVSPLCLGCMSFGDAQKGHLKWVLNEEDSRAVIRRALEAGINFFDTANVYSQGTSEEMLGRALGDFARREEIAVATKVYGKVREGANGWGLSRKAILAEIDNSLRRLQMDYVDLYIIHRWDYDTPIEETMQALHDVVRAGKARYIGASAMYAWQFQKALYTAERHGWTRFVSMQNHWNLIYREEEREMIPLCRAENIVCTPYSPLAAGRLARPPQAAESARAQSDAIAKQKYGAAAQADLPIIERLGEVAKRLGLARAQVALAWLMHKKPGTIPIIGVSKMAQLEEALPAVDVELPAEDIQYLEALYQPHAVVGAQ